MSDGALRPASVWRPALVAWLLFCLGVAIQTLRQSDPMIDADSDSIMRLLQVRDWLAGQGWFDLTQYRLGGADGTPMHWTRLGDLGPAALILVLTPLAGASTAEVLAGLIYPPLLFLPFIVLALLTARRIAPRDAAADTNLTVVITALQFSVLLYFFMPGMLDHHNLQQIGLMALICGSVGERTRLSGIYAGCGIMLGIAVGPDAVLLVMAATVALALIWAVNPEREKRFLLAMGATVLIAVGPLAFTLLPRPWTVNYCDGWTAPVAVMMLLYGLVLLAMAGPLARLQTRTARLAAAGLLGTAALGAILLAFPACRDPLPLNNPLIQEYWMSLINENMSLKQMIALRPYYLIGVYIIPLLSLGVMITGIQRGWLKISDILPLMLALPVALVLTMVHLRGWPMLNALTLPLIAIGLARFRLSPGLGRRLGGWVLFSPVIYLAAGSQLSERFTLNNGGISSKDKPLYSLYCLEAPPFAALSALPVGTVGASFNATPLVLKYTPHRGLAAGYHRNARTNLEFIQWMIAPADVARTMPVTTQIDYVLACPADEQWQYTVDKNPQSLSAALIAGQAPSWLKPVLSLPDKGVVYAVKR